VNNLRNKYNKTFQVGEKKIYVALPEGFGVSPPSKKLPPAPVIIENKLSYPQCM